MKEGGTRDDGMRGREEMEELGETERGRETVTAVSPAH